MEKYTVVCDVVSQACCEVEAESPEAALRKANDGYDNSQVDMDEFSEPSMRWDRARVLNAELETVFDNADTGEA